MRKLLSILLVTLLLIAIPGTMILASDISNSLYRMTVLISNNSTAANYVATNSTNISTNNLIDGDFISATAGECVVRDAGGTDRAFMPGYDTNPWCFFVPISPAYSYLEYYLYTANSTGGSIAYFPADAGMLVSDNATLECAANFTIDINGWVDTTNTGEYILTKPGAFTIEIPAIGSISAGIPTDGTYNPDANPEVTSCDGYAAYNVGVGDTWDNCHDAAAGTSATAAGALITTIRCDANVDKYDQFYRSFVLFDTSPIPDGAGISAATLKVRGTAKSDDKPWGDSTLNVYSSNPAGDTDIVVADFDEVGATPFATAIAYADFDAADWNTFTLNAAGIAAIDDTGITKFSIREATYDVPDNPLPWSNGDELGYFMSSADAGNAPILTVSYTAVEVTAINQDPNDYFVSVYADSANMTISVNGAGPGDDGYDTAALGGISVPDNNNDWQFFLNQSMPYVEDISIDIGGVPVSAWAWEYDTTFHDSIGANDATPSFRTASSDVDVEATAVSFQPVDEAKAPPWTLDTSTPTWLTASNVTGNFTTTPTPTYPGHEVIEAVSAATGTPAQLPFTVLFGFIALAVSLSISAILRDYGSRSLFVKTLIIGVMMGIGEALQVVDFWMLIFFVVIALAIMAASKYGDVT